MLNKINDLGAGETLKRAASSYISTPHIFWKKTQKHQKHAPTGLKGLRCVREGGKSVKLERVYKSDSYGDRGAGNHGDI